MRPDFKTVADDLNLLEHLAKYRPVIIGTPPLGIATEDSDIDIACTAPDLEEFGSFVESAFGHLNDFAFRFLHETTEPAALASFFSSGWRIELFCQRLDTEDQWGFAISAWSNDYWLWSPGCGPQSCGQNGSASRRNPPSRGHCV